jgi:hypothetical protein
LQFFSQDLAVLSRIIAVINVGGAAFMKRLFILALILVTSVSAATLMNYSFGGGMIQFLEQFLATFLGLSLIVFYARPRQSGRPPQQEFRQAYYRRKRNLD